MWDWVYANPHAAVGVVVTSVAAIYGAVHWALGRHGEFVEFKGHMDREEKQVWPEVKKLTTALADFRRESQEARDQFQQDILKVHSEFQTSVRSAHTEFRLEVIKMHFDHGERLAGLETAMQVNTTETRGIAKQVNGQTTTLTMRIDAMKREIDILQTALDEANRRADMLAAAAAETLKKKGG